MYMYSRSVLLEACPHMTSFLSSRYLSLFFQLHEQSYSRSSDINMNINIDNVLGAELLK